MSKLSNILYFFQNYSNMSICFAKILKFFLKVCHNFPHFLKFSQNILNFESKLFINLLRTLLKKFSNIFRKFFLIKIVFNAPSLPPTVESLATALYQSLILYVYQIKIFINLFSNCNFIFFALRSTIIYIYLPFY